MKSSLRSNYFQAEPHDYIEMKVEAHIELGATARLSVDGVGFLSLSALSKEQVIRIYNQASAALASWPADCEGYRCTNKATGTMRDPETLEDIPACPEHADDEGSEVLPEVAA